MALIQWNDGMKVNIKIIDQQHEQLVRMVNEFHDSLLKGSSKELLGKLLTNLINYTITHFSTEEKYFKQFGYPDSPAHIKEHQALKDKVGDMKKRFDNNQLLLTVEVTNLLRDWLTHHIKAEDMKYSAFFKSKGLS